MLRIQRFASQADLWIMVTNDKVYAAFALYEGGIIDKRNLISELKAYKLVDQYLFHTDKALKAVKFIEAKEVIL